MKKIDKRILAAFFENMSFLLSAGVDPLTASGTLAATKNKQAKRMAQAVQRELSGGHDLSEAVERSSTIFGKGNYSAYISAGIKSGHLPQVLLRLSGSIDSSSSIKKQVTGALAYPLVLLVITIFSSIYLFTSTVPQMAANMQDIGGQQLPAFTRTVLGIVSFCTEHKLLLIIGFGAVIVILKVLLTAFGGNVAYIKTRIPVVGKILISADMVDYYSNLSNLLNAGTPISEALDVCISGIKNRYIKSQMHKQSAMYKEHGRPYGESFSCLSFIPDTEKQCLQIADKTGNIPEMLFKLSEKRQQDLRQDTKALLTFVEPAMILIMGCIIASVVVAVYLPMLAMTNI